MSLVFEDLNTYDGRHTEFPVCNESIAAWRNLLKDIRVEKAAAICSGGEVSFFAILPLVDRELDLIDHSYVSMYYAIGKHHVIEKLGAAEAYKAMVEARSADLKSLFDEANQGLPMENRGKKTGYGYSYYDSVCYDLPKPLRKLTEQDFEAFLAAKDKLRFYHGCLVDLPARGPYDLVYLSNALDYAGRDNIRQFPIKDMVKPGGYVCWTQGVYANKPTPVADLEIVEEYALDNYKRDVDAVLCWKYVVAKAPESTNEEG